MKNENFGLNSFSFAREGVTIAELLTEKNIKTVNINFHDAKRLKEWVRSGGFGILERKNQMIHLNDHLFEF